MEFAKLNDSYWLCKSGRWYKVFTSDDDEDADPEIKAETPEELVRKIGQNPEIMAAYRSGNLEIQDDGAKISQLLDAVKYDDSVYKEVAIEN